MINNIISMRQQGKSYTSISKVVGIHRNKIASICKEYGCAVDVSPNVVAANIRKGKIATEAKTIENTFVCNGCGKTYVRNKNRWGDGDCGSFFCSKECAYEHRFDDYVYAVKNDKNVVYFPVCVICGKHFTSRHINTKTCSDVCRVAKANKDAYNKSKADKETNQEEIKCKECGKIFKPKYGNKKRIFCSRSCSQRYTNKHKDKTTVAYKAGRARQRRNRRARLLNAFVETVRIEVLFDRDRGRCQLCGKKLNDKRVVPHPMAVTLDHIIPLSKGGEHSYRNTQLACYSCNTKKGNRVWNGAEQLLLFGT